MTDRLRIATRGSPLARWQADRVAGLLGALHSGLVVETVVVETRGDADRTTAIVELAGQGVFVKEVQAAVLDGRADLAVHSAKDLMSTPTPGLTMSAVPERGDHRDALVGCSLASLPAGAVVATGSVRRRAQLADLRPDLAFVELRGNMATRISAADRPEIDAVVVAAAALERLGVAHRTAEVLDPVVMVPQVGQGALAVECVTDGVAATMVEAIDDPAARRGLEAERAYLAGLGGGCDLPVGGWAMVDGEEIELLALLATPDGRIVLRHRERGTDPVAVGEAATAHLLDEGGRWLLDR